MNCLTVLKNNNLASGSADKTIIIWSSKKWTKLRVLKAHTNAVWSLLEIPNKNLLLSGSWDLTIRIWDLENYEH